MSNFDSFRSLVGRKVEQLFLVVWPPYCEKTMADVDISAAFQFGDGGSAMRISIDSDDNWTPVMSRLCDGRLHHWADFGRRLDGWMSGQIDDVMRFEIYDVSDEPLFSGIVSQKVAAVELVSLEDGSPPFGVKIKFANDYLMVTPIVDGSTVETMNFNKIDNLETFSHLGKIRYLDLANCGD